MEDIYIKLNYKIILDLIINLFLLQLYLFILLILIIIIIKCIQSIIRCYE